MRILKFGIVLVAAIALCATAVSAAKKQTGDPKECEGQWLGMCCSPICLCICAYMCMLVDIDASVVVRTCVRYA